MKIKYNRKVEYNNIYTTIYSFDLIFYKSRMLLDMFSTKKHTISLSFSNNNIIKYGILLSLSKPDNVKQQHS